MRALIVTGSRADVGPLTPVQKALSGTWLHVEPHPSMTAFDSAVAAAKACEVTAKHLAPHRYDYVVVLGDRYEVLGAAMAAHLMHHPIVHLSGGDISSGSLDDSMRHAITKMAHLHFPTHRQAADRILSMGEEPWRVHTVGCPGVDYLASQHFLSREDTLAKLKMPGRYVLVNYQPATLLDEPLKEVEALLLALKRIGLPCVFATLNTDEYGSRIEQAIMRFCLVSPHVYLNMDNNLYLSAMKHCEFLIGNSSSGIYEAPTLKKPFVNVGQRQSGRVTGNSVFWTQAEPEDICVAVREATAADPTFFENPFGDGTAAAKIKFTLTNMHSAISRGRLLRKRWSGSCLSTDDGSLFMPTEVGGITPVKTSSGGLNRHTPIPVKPVSLT